MSKRHVLVIVDMNEPVGLSPGATWGLPIMPWWPSGTNVSDPNAAREFVERGDLAYDRGDLKRAIDLYTKASRLDPSNASTFNNRGVAREVRGDLDGAIADYTEAIRLDPLFARAYRNRGDARSSRGQHRSALADYTEAIGLDAECPEVRFNRGLLRLDLRDCEGAIDDLTEALRFGLPDASAYLLRGVARLGKREYDRAIADLTESLVVGPSPPPLATWYRGHAWFAKGRYEHALSDFAACGDPAWSRAGRAWVRAACPDARYRDGAQALDLATWACRISDWHDMLCLSALAAAYAEVGDYVEAERRQWDANRLDTDAVLTKGWLRLEHYRNERPYRGPLVE